MMPIRYQRGYNDIITLCREASYVIVVDEVSRQGRIYTSDAKN